MADESRWRDGRYGMDEQERNRWNTWRDERDHGRSMRSGRYGRESGGSWGEPDPGRYGPGGGHMGREDWREPPPDYERFGYGRDYGAPYRGPGYGYGDAGYGAAGSGFSRNRNPGPGRYEDRERGWFDRAADEVSSWFRGGGDGGDGRGMETGPDRRGKGPKGYVRSEQRIREDVCDRLCDDRLVDASDIDVSVSGSEVTLSGTVATRQERRRAEDCAEQVSGVTHVQNNLRVAGTSAGMASPMASTTGVRPTTGKESPLP